MLSHQKTVPRARERKDEGGRRKDEAETGRLRDGATRRSEPQRVLSPRRPVPASPRQYFILPPSSLLFPTLAIPSIKLDPAPLLLKSLDLAPDKLAFERGRAVEEDDAVAVIRLVQHAARF